MLTETDFSESVTNRNRTVTDYNNRQVPDHKFSGKIAQFLGKNDQKYAIFCEGIFFLKKKLGRKVFFQKNILFQQIFCKFSNFEKNITIKNGIKFKNF